ncbi:response regulator [Virgibacillus phasianinus]|nr:response regulator [Virgibacillus phasianinus]
MRILIAEDELLERKAMRKFIEDNFSDIDVVGEAENGRKAITLANTLAPDIIFMDIKMPGINGLEAIEQINSVTPSIKFILVSAYDSFDYAKKAMRFGIKEYILKPGKKDEIVKALLRVQKEIEEERVQSQEKMQSDQLLKERLIMKLMHHTIDESVMETQRDLYPDMKSGFFLVCSGADWGQLEETLARCIADPYILLQSEGNITVCVLAQKIHSKADLLTLARKIQLDSGMFIGIGYPYTHIGQLPKSYSEAYAACFQLAGEQNSRYGFLKRTKERAIDEVISTILDEVTKGNNEQAIATFKKHASRFSSADRENLYIEMKSILLKRDIATEEHSVSALKSTQDFQTFITMSCLKLNEYYQSKQYLMQAKTYIQNHYQSAITLEETASFVNLSPNYFSNLFKQEIGETFIDYLTKVRLQKAKELIEENLYSLKEISYMVGYKDPNYFSRVFKKYYHDSPKRFQQGIFKK